MKKAIPGKVTKILVAEHEEKIANLEKVIEWQHVFIAALASKVFRNDVRNIYFKKATELTISGAGQNAVEETLKELKDSGK